MKNIHVLTTDKQSSVEWYAKESNKIIADAFRGYIKGHEWHLLEQKALEKAKAMHKQDNENTWLASVEYALLVLKDKTSKDSKESFEKYYNDTYGND